MNDILSECASLEFEKEFSEIREKALANKPDRMIDCIINGDSRLVYNPKYVFWLEDQRDQWLMTMLDLKVQKKNLIEDLKQLFLDQSTNENLSDRGVVLDKIQSLVNKWSDE